LATVPRSIRVTGDGLGASEQPTAIAETITNDTATAMRAPVPLRIVVRPIKAAVLPLTCADSAGFG
jgi:pyrrolidone-carboxylate peptidase